MKKLTCKECGDSIIYGVEPPRIKCKEVCQKCYFKLKESSRLPRGEHIR